LAKAVIFDIDGTLLNSVDLHAKSWVRAFSHFGITANFQVVRRRIGEGADRLLPVFVPAPPKRDERKSKSIGLGSLGRSIYRGFSHSPW
jgi:beta-phosphoglucomutase-like phosphatase (HAD superfamily)